jgi:carbon storage regulator
MLILTRRIGEKVRIGDDITVVIVDAWGQQVRMGIGAPRDVQTNRQQVHALIKQKNDTDPTQPQRNRIVMTSDP